MDLDSLIPGNKVLEHFKIYVCFYVFKYETMYS